MNCSRFHTVLTQLAVLFLLCFGSPGFGADKPAESKDVPGKVSYFQDVRPILMKSCAGCHQPGNAEGELDLTTHSAVLRGGSGDDTVVPGNPSDSTLYAMITGNEPEMPLDGDPLDAQQVEIIRAWIAQGAKDDTPEPVAEVKPPTYRSAPAITTLAFSPDGELLAVGGYHEVVIHQADGSQTVGRLVGRMPRIEDIAFSPDGTHLAVAGGAQTQFGAVQLWNVAAQKQIKEIRIGYDTLFGLDYHPDGRSVSVGSTDNTARWINLDSGETELRFAPHAGWVVGTSFDNSGTTLLSASQDHTVKMADLESGEFAGIIRSGEITSFAAHPQKDWIACGLKNGQVRLYDLAEGRGQLQQRKGSNPLHVIKQEPGPITSLAFSPNGQHLAAGCSEDARIYNTENGKQTAKLSPHDGPVFAIDFRPDGKVVATGGFDGVVRLFDPASGKLISEFPPVPLRGTPVTSREDTTTTGPTQP